MTQVPNNLRQIGRAFHESSPKRISARRNFTTALWTAIALTGTTQWLNDATHIAPTSEAWKKWIAEAEQQVAPDRRIDGSIIDLRRLGHGERTRQKILNKQGGHVLIPDWDYQDRLTRLLKAEPAETRGPLNLDPPEAGSTGLSPRGLLRRRFSRTPTESVPVPHV